MLFWSLSWPKLSGVGNLESSQWKQTEVVCQSNSNRCKKKNTETFWVCLLVLFWNRKEISRDRMKIGWFALSWKRLQITGSVRPAKMTPKGTKQNDQWSTEEAQGNSWRFKGITVELVWHLCSWHSRGSCSSLKTISAPKVFQIGAWLSTKQLCKRVVHWWSWEGLFEKKMQHYV